MYGQSHKKTSESKPLLVLPDCGDWSHQEHCEIDRIRVTCAEHPNLQLEYGQTDEGDPWCIVHDDAHDQVISHITRIDRHYIVSLRQRRLQGTATIAQAVECVLRELAHDRRQGHNARRQH